MSSLLIEIAKELAAEYPKASSQQIVDIIVNTIESSSVISQAISAVTIPTPVQRKHAELLSKRLPRKRVSKDKAKIRTTLLEHLDNADLLQHLKLFYALPVEDAGLGPIIGLDGARVGRWPSRQVPDTGHSQMSVPIWSNVDGTGADIPMAFKGTSVGFSTNIISEAPNRSARETTFTSLEFLTDVGGGSGHLLSLDNIYRIIVLLQLYCADEQIVAKISEAVREDVKLRNRNSKTDCLDELYRGDEQLPEQMRVQRPKVTDYFGMIRQLIRAIILSEYKRLQREAGQKFIEGKISYDAYVRDENKIAVYCNELYAALP